MAGKKKKQTKDSKYEFVLTGQPKSFFKGKTKADFTPVDGVKSIPVFNFDCLHYTPSFIVLPIYQEKSLDEYLSTYQEKLQNNEQISADKILVPKPRSKSKYCSVCQKYYDDYLAHVTHPTHKQQLRNSNYQAHIINLCSKYAARSERSAEKYDSLRSETEAVDVYNLI